MTETKIPPAIPGEKSSSTELLTVDEACKQLRISRWSFYRLVNQRELATIQIGRRRLVPKTAVTAFIERRLEGAV